MPRIALVLPPREDFCASAAGAIALVIHRLAQATPDAVVLGTPPTGPAFPNIPFTATGRRDPTPLAYMLGIARHLARLAAPVIEVHQQPRLARLLTALFPGRRVTLVLHNDPLTMRGLKSPRQRAATLHAVRQVVTVSQVLADRYRQHLPPGTTGPTTLHNPIDLAALPPRPRQRRPEFLFVGRVTRDKGADLFVEACATALPRLPGWSARIIGGERFGTTQPDSPFFNTIRTAATAAGVICTGYQPQAQVLEAMAQAAIVVMPSRMIEGLPLTAIEAMASGAALIATRQGGLPEAAGPAARYVPVGDAEALAEAMHTLATDIPALTALAKTGLDRARQFDTPVIAAAWEALRGA